MRNMPEDDYWLNLLNVHLDHVEKQFALDKDQAIEQLAKKWGKRICDLVAKEVGFGNKVRNDTVDFITGLVDEYPKESRQFIYLTEFAKRKRKEAVLSIAEEKLHIELLSSPPGLHHSPVGASNKNSTVQQTQFQNFRCQLAPVKGRASRPRQRQ